MTQTVSFEDLVDVKIDNRGKTPPLVDIGYPLLEVNAVSRSRLYPDLSKVSKFVDQETYDTWFRQHLQKDDILFTTVGTIAESAIIPEGSNATIAQNILGFRFKREFINPLFALYIMRSRWFLHQIGGRTVETVQKSIKWADMRGIKIELPELETQDKIADILGMIDEKIELNRKMKETLEQMGQALFRHYFIDNPEAEKIALSTIMTLERGVEPGSKAYKTTKNENDVAFFRVGDLGSRSNEIYVDITLTKNKIARDSDILISFDGAPGLVGYGFNGSYSSGLRKAGYKSNDLGSGYAYFLLSCSKSQQTIDMHTTGTTIKHASGAIEYMQAWLSKNEQDYVQINDIFKAMLLNTKQIQTLTTLRDTLLPRLINGKVKV